MGIEAEGISCCFDQEAEKMLKDFRRDGLSETATAIASSIGKEAIEGATILELGCGFGALAIDFIRNGAKSAVGVDLSPKMIQLARALAAEAGLSQAVSFQLGDAAVADLGSSDIVVLDSVLCCYPDVSALIDNSSPAARRYYAISMPDDGRIATRLLRVVLPFQIAIFRRDGFRFFIHPTEAVRGRLESKGFKLVSKKSTGWIWSVFVFAAPDAG